MTATRATAAVALAAVLAACAWLLLHDDGGYRIHAQFADAGLLVKGGEVKVAGRTVGSIADIDVAPDGVADVTLELDGDEVVPLHRGTRAQIRSLGAATITNRYVSLEPGPASLPALRDGATLPTTQTAGIVNLDALLDTFDAPTRRNLQELLGRSAELFAGSGAPAFNRMLARFAPAAREFGLAAGDLAADEAQLGRLVRGGAVAARTIATRRPELGDAIDSSARWMSAVAAQREDLVRTLERAPRALRSGRTTLADADRAVRRLRPALRAVPAAARPLDAFLTRAGPAVRDGGPVAQEIVAQLPAVRRGLRGLRRLAADGVPALRLAGQGMEDLRPIFRGLRIYAPDVVLGLINGLAGVSASNYNELGHYARLEFIQNPQTTIGGAMAKLLTGQALIPGITNVRTGLNQRCPGAAAPPSPDGSSPIAATDLCDPRQDVPQLVNEPPKQAARR